MNREGYTEKDLPSSIDASIIREITKRHDEKNIIMNDGLIFKTLNKSSVLEWCNVVKKGNSNIARMLAAIVLTGILLYLLYIHLNEQENVMPPPDRIIVYRNGVSMVLKPDDILYDKIFGAIVINSSDILETSIENDAVQEAKSYYAIEYIYDNKQSIAGNRQPSRIMCFLHGPYEGEAAFGDETHYSSGTSPFICKNLFLVHEVDAILSCDD